MNKQLQIKILALLTTILGLNLNVRAQEVVDPLKETQKVLRDKDKREKAVQEGGDNAKKADAYAEKVVGSENKDDIYDLSADLMAVLDKETGGDPEKMLKILAEAGQNPEAFYQRFPAAQKEKFKKLIEKMPKQSKP